MLDFWRVLYMTVPFGTLGAILSTFHLRWLQLVYLWLISPAIAALSASRPVFHLGTTLIPPYFHFPFLRWTGSGGNQGDRRDVF